jgi:putative aldouronate transport system substrate-binding protein
MSKWTVDRRQLLQAAGGLVALASVAPVLAGCGGSSDDAGQTTAANDSAMATSSGKASSSSAVSSSGASPTASGGRLGGILPAYVPDQSVKPDLPVTTSGVPAAFFTYPASPKQVYSAPPASGGTVSVLKFVKSGLPPAVGSNPYWQELNKRVGAEMKFTNIVNADYWPKVATTVAGGDLPDLMQLNSSSKVPAHLSDILKAKFQDLSPWLSGDKIKNFPSLAAIPTSAWRDVAFNGGIYGVPKPQPEFAGGDYAIRQDIVDKLGLSSDLRDGDDLIALCKGLTDAKHNRWALDSIPDAMTLVCEMTGAPNQWLIKDGAFISQYTTDEYKQALGIVRSMWSDGYIEPESLTSTSSLLEWFVSGRTAIEAGAGWAVIHQQGIAADPNFKISGLIPPKWAGGGQAAHYGAKGSWTFAGLKKADDSRIETLLKVLDWFAAPFGSEEYLFVNFGIPQRDYTLKGSDPVSTKVGITECVDLYASYVGSPLAPIYFPGLPDVAKAQYDHLTKLLSVPGVPLPTAGLVSETDQDKGASLDKAITDTMTDIVVGRKKLSDWDAAVKSWQSGGGTAIAEEYAKSYAQAPAS